jgi:hypothetical protein
VKKLIHGKNKKAPPIVIIPLTKDGCVNTEVNLKLAIAKITLGCSQGDEESA